MDEFYSALTALNIRSYASRLFWGDAGPLDERLNRFNLSILLGYPYEELMTIASLIFGGVSTGTQTLMFAFPWGWRCGLFSRSFIGMTQFGAWVQTPLKNMGFRPFSTSLVRCARRWRGGSSATYRGHD